MTSNARGYRGCTQRAASQGSARPMPWAGGGHISLKLERRYAARSGTRQKLMPLRRSGSPGASRAQRDNFSLHEVALLGAAFHGRSRIRPHVDLRTAFTRDRRAGRPTPFSRNLLGFLFHKRRSALIAVASAIGPAHVTTLLGLRVSCGRPTPTRRYCDQNRLPGTPGAPASVARRHRGTRTARPGGSRSRGTSRTPPPSPG